MLSSAVEILEISTPVVTSSTSSYPFGISMLTILSNTVFEVNVAVLTGVKKFDENKENTVAVRRNNLLGKWYISFNYPFWKIKEYDSSDEVEKAVHSGEADCFVVKAGQSLKTMADSKMCRIFLTKSCASCFAVARDNTTLMNILNKTIQTLPDSRLSSQFYVYENAPGKVTLAEYIKDNLRVVSIWFVSVVLIIVWIIVYLLIQARKAQIQAEKANAAKSDFLFNMSHDIRTPMNALLGYSELIKRKLTDPKLLDYQEKMEQSGNLLLSIINNVLDMAKIESGKMELDENYVQIRDIYHGVYKIFQAEAEKKGIHLEMEYEVQHEHVICDETKNREIFLNLISNAVKYTASGGAVTIRITELDCDRKDYVRIQTQLIDTGIGMSEEFLPSLFEAFARERTNKYHIIRATLESLAYQVNDVLVAMKADSGIDLTALKVDGGASANDFLMQTQANIIDAPVNRPQCVETTAMGAAYLAGLAVGYWSSKEDVIKNWAIDKTFEPQIDAAKREEMIKGWNKAVKYAYGWAKED